MTLLSPPLAGTGETVPMNLLLNAAGPMQLGVLHADLCRLDLRARDLQLLVRRWAKDRALCHSSKGLLSPYAWTLLTVYFLQVGAHDDGEAPLLPPLSDFPTAGALAVMPTTGGRQEAADDSQPAPAPTVP